MRNVQEIAEVVASLPRWLNVSNLIFNGLVVFIYLRYGERIWRWFGHKRKWVPLPGYYPGARISAPAEVNPHFVATALQNAETFILQNTGWTAVELAFVGHMLRVWIGRPPYLETWQGFPYVLITTPDLNGLCDQFIFVCEQVIDRRPEKRSVLSPAEDPGKLEAVGLFRRWLKDQK